MHEVERNAMTKMTKAQIEAVERYQKRTGYKTISFKVKGDIGERFAGACSKAGRSKASVITELMERYIVEQS